MKLEALKLFVWLRELGVVGEASRGRSRVSEWKDERSDVTATKPVETQPLKLLGDSTSAL
jgi:hypothetical protein